MMSRRKSHLIGASALCVGLITVIALAAPVPVAQAPAQVCAGRVDSSSHSRHENDGRRTWIVQLSGSDCRLDLRAEEPGGMLRLDVIERGVRRQLEVETLADGSVRRKWRVDGREREYDAAADAWVTAVLAQIEQPASASRISALRAAVPSRQVLARVERSAAEEVSLIEAAGRRDNEHETVDHLRRVAARPMTSEGRQAFLEAVSRLEADHYATEMLRTLIRSEQSLGASDINLILRILPQLEDHYSSEMLRLLLDADLTEPSLLAIVDTARALPDHYEAEMLRKVLGHPGATARVRSATLISAEQLARHYRDDIRRSAERRN